METRKDRRVSKIRRDVKDLKYRGRDLGKIITKTQSYLNEWEVRDLIRKMPISDKVHMEERAWPVYKVSKLYKITPGEYLSNDSIMIYIADQGYKSLIEVKHNDPKAAKLIKKRGLEEEVFQDFLSSKPKLSTK